MRSTAANPPRRGSSKHSIRCRRSARPAKPSSSASGTKVGHANASNVCHSGGGCWVRHYRRFRRRSQGPGRRSAPLIAPQLSGSTSSDLARLGGVITPPADVDPQIKRMPLHSDDPTPVIPPPGTPGGDQSINQSSRIRCRVGTLPVEHRIGRMGPLEAASAQGDRAAR